MVVGGGGGGGKGGKSRATKFGHLENTNMS